MAFQSAHATSTDGVTLRAMTAQDLPATHALSAALRWPHRLVDWAQAFNHAQGLVAERDGAVVGSALCWPWGPQHATIGLVIVDEACRGRRIGHRLMTGLLDTLAERSVLLNATADGRGLYERLGFVRTGEVRQHQGVALPAPLVALDAGWRLRPAGHNDLPALCALDTQARGMPRVALIADLFAQAEASVVLDHEGQARGFGLLRRFGRGHVVGPVVAPDTNAAKAVIAHLVGLNAGHFTRIDIDFDSGLAEWLEALGLLRVDAVTAMRRGPATPGPALASAGTPKLYAPASQAMG